MKKIALATAILIASAGAFAQGAKSDAPAAPTADAKQDMPRHGHDRKGHHKKHHEKHHDEGKSGDAKGATPATPATPAAPAK